MDRRTKMVCNAPTIAIINNASNVISNLKHHISYGVWVFSAVTFVLLAMRAPISYWAATLAAALTLGGLYWRWTFISNQLRDARIEEYELTDSVDLAWLAWVRDLEPEIDVWLVQNSVEGHLTSKDFQQAYWRHAYYWIDVPGRAPYHGDTERCFADLEKRREPQRLARAVGHRDVK